MVPKFNLNGPIVLAEFRRIAKVIGSDMEFVISCHLTHFSLD